ncbi:hypothetical protein FA95DRAFT_1613752 [Auriscalpium vulgare]|uniref:Uncharacterized protein n=1 Tax=Auriscalpium vulgare TaxID=40419 RepID=A0ACB8R1P8_9AGAM|nr:hypothetical protein FA95DRAFT_1613752 [Auriscalpium vulgare]
MAILPDARIPILWLNVKMTAADIVKSAYKLKDIPEAKYAKNMARVLEGGRKGRLYIFPGNIATMKFNTGLPFCHSAIIDVLEDRFFGADAKFRFPEALYVNISPEHNQPVIPPVMLAFVATTIDAGLQAYKLGPGGATKIIFTADKFKLVYQDHLRRLARLKARDPAAFWRMLARLYEEASSGTSHHDPNEFNDGSGEEADSEDNDDIFNVKHFVTNFAQAADATRN